MSRIKRSGHHLHQVAAVRRISEAVSLKRTFLFGLRARHVATEVTPKFASHLRRQYLKEVLSAFGLKAQYNGFYKFYKGSRI